MSDDTSCGIVGCKRKVKEGGKVKVILGLLRNDPAKRFFVEVCTEHQQAIDAATARST